jgi:hypothetical protein
MTERLVRALAALAAAMSLVAACGGSEGDGTTRADQGEVASSDDGGTAPWLPPPDPLRRARAAGLEPQRRELLDYHVHAHLDVFVDGRRVPVPAGIGINVSDPGVQSGETEHGKAYGGISLCDEPCISPLHTHDPTGILHTESLQASPNVLGQFFTEWGVRLDGSCVGAYCEPETPIVVYVDGEQYDEDPAEIELTDGRQIAVVIGTPPAQIPASYDFTGKT